MSFNSTRMAGPASLLMFIGCCASLTYWGTQWIAPQARAMAPQPALQTDPALAAGLFGQQVQGAAGRFVLTGVVAAEDEADSVAIVSADGKPGQALQVGNQVQDGVRVEEIHPAYIVLSVGGASQRVPIQEKAAATAAPPADTVASTPATTATASAAAAGRDPHNEAAQETYFKIPADAGNGGVQMIEKGMIPSMSPAAGSE